VPVPTTQTQYDLDSVGNWSTKTQNGTPETRTHSLTNEITHIGAVPVLSDLNGNTVDDELYTYAYDEENRLIAVTRKSDSSVVGQYQYDALSRRVTKMANAGIVSSPVETRYFYDEARLVE
jgi:YD repeat-containing protein